MMNRNLTSLLLFFLAHISAFAMAQYEGAWKLVTSFDGQDMKERADLLPATNKGVIVTLRKQDDTMYSLTASVANKLMTRVKVLGPTQDGSGELVEIGVVMSTKMMAPPELQPMESFLQTVLPGMTQMILEDGDLSLSGPSGKIVCKKEEEFEY